MRDDLPFRQSAALLAIHSAISYSDALRLSLDDQPRRLKNHSEASAELRRLLASTPIETNKGLRHLEYLVSVKDFVAYGDQRLDESSFRLVLINAERFTAWALEASRALKLKGWTTDAN